MTGAVRAGPASRHFEMLSAIAPGYAEPEARNTGLLSASIAVPHGALNAAAGLGTRCAPVYMRNQASER